MNGYTWWEEILFMVGVLWVVSLAITGIKSIVVRIASKFIDDTAGENEKNKKE